MTAQHTFAENTSAPYEVGHGKPPRRTRFRKGQSDNPGDRPRRLPVRLASALLKEAYRCVAIKENGRMVPVMALQAILRSQVELAMNSNFRAQRYVLEEVRHLESLKAIGFYSETDFDLTDGYDETDEVGESDGEDERDEEDENDEADETGEGWEEDETGESDETGSDDTGMVVTAAPDPAPPPEGSAAPPVSSAAPPAAPESSPLVDDSAPPRRQRRPAAAGRRREPTRAAAGGKPSRRSPQRTVRRPRAGGAEIPPANSGSAESRKIPCSEAMKKRDK